MIRRLGWATARDARGRDPDEPLALAALSAAGVSVDVVEWEGPEVDWSSFDRVVIRSTWDYTERLAPFIAWLEAVDRATDLRNPRPMVVWSLDKRYLIELRDAGIRIPATLVVEPGAEAALPPHPFVLKPVVGAGSRDAASYTPEQHLLAHQHLRRVHERGTAVLVQPLLSHVAEEGESALLFFGGEFSHAARKRVSLSRAGEVDGLFAHEETAPIVVEPEELALAGDVMSFVSERFGTPTYARIDVVRGADGEPCVLEVELAEPSLFLAEGGPVAVRRLVRALLAA